MTRYLPLALLALTLVTSPRSAHADPAMSPVASDKIAYSQLSPEEREIVDRGEISEGQYIAGGVVGTLIGLGIGEAIQGRYVPTGLVITLGEITSATLLAVGEANCVVTAINDIGVQEVDGGSCLGAAGTIGLIGILGFRIWEIVDVWATPPSVNARYRALRDRLQVPTRSSSMELIPAMARAGDGSRFVDGAALAYQIRF